VDPRKNDLIVDVDLAIKSLGYEWLLVELRKHGRIMSDKCIFNL
jgi:hypothetical protein